jgi:hypothetical protein
MRGDETPGSAPAGAKRKAGRSAKSRAPDQAASCPGAWCSRAPVVGPGENILIQ